MPTINLRATPQTRDLIDRAAALLGQTRTEFMLAAARRRAEEVLLDQTVFVLGEADFATFASILDNPPPPSERLKALMRSKPAWAE